MDPENNSVDQVMMVTGLAFPLGRDQEGWVAKFKYKSLTHPIDDYLLFHLCVYVIQVTHA